MIPARPLVRACVSALLVWVVTSSLAPGAARQELDQTLLLTTAPSRPRSTGCAPCPASLPKTHRSAALAGTGPLSDANTYLETVAAHAGADDLFLIDAEGETNAASNWTRPSSFEGENYAFRPYFQNALAPGRGQFYAIGVTTSVLGYSLSARVVVDDRQLISAVCGGYPCRIAAVTLDVRWTLDND